MFWVVDGRAGKGGAVTGANLGGNTGSGLSGGVDELAKNGFVAQFPGMLLLSVKDFGNGNLR